MKKLGLLVFLAVSLTACGQQDVSLDSTAQKASYALGQKSGQRLHARAPEIDVAAFVAGLRDGANGSSQLTTEEMSQALSTFQQEMTAKKKADRESAAKSNKAEAAAFLKKNADKDGVVTLPSGVQYIVEKAGDKSSPTPTLNDKVVADYTGKLLDGTVFDSSIKRGKPATFPLSQVIEGWKKALVHMHVGAKWKVFIPPELAYGEHGVGNVIGPNELLVFEVTLKEIIPGDTAEK